MLYFPSFFVFRNIVNQGAMGQMLPANAAL